MGPGAVLEIGEAFAGEGAEAAHVNTLLGPRSGPVGAAFASALASPSAGHVPFVAVLRPGFPARPMTLFVNKAGLAGDAHARLTWGAAQAGVAAGVVDAVAAGILGRVEMEAWALVAAVWVSPEARDEAAVYANNRRATREALAAGRGPGPALDALVEAARLPRNPFFSAPPDQ